MNRYHIVHRVEHCHRCRHLDLCTVRLNEIGPRSKKTALCPDCAPKEQP